MKSIARGRRRTKCRDPLTGMPLVERALRRLKLLDEVRALKAQRAYALACGAHLQERTRPERCHHGILTVRVESAAWASELNYVRDDLLQRIHKVPGGERVRGLRFHVGPLSEVPLLVDPAQEPGPRPAPVALDPNVAAALTQVNDDDLRDALGALYVRACRSGKRG